VLLDVRLDTGRTHQIRVHLAAFGHPIVGDVLYGGEVHAGLERQFLHAYRLSFRSPSSWQQLQFESPLPMDLQSIRQVSPLFPARSEALQNSD
jgi:23S rRNA pseudouridine1911/1915/1917 synthase